MEELCIPLQDFSQDSRKILNLSITSGVYLFAISKYRVQSQSPTPPISC